MLSFATRWQYGDGVNFLCMSNLAYIIFGFKTCTLSVYCCSSFSPPPPPDDFLLQVANLEQQERTDAYLPVHMK